MQHQKIKKIVILGGGTAGWMTAAALSHVLKRQYHITLVESDQIATIGVGEATIPMLRAFNDILELDENEFMKATQATFKLGIEFVNWGAIGDRYIHGFGRIGQDTSTVEFHQYWLKQYLAGKAGEIDEYSINNAACLENKCMRKNFDVPNSPLQDIGTAFHFDAGLYAAFLRKFSEQRGVNRIEGKVVNVNLSPENGFISSIQLEGDRVIDGDLFVDCSGFRSLLLGDALKTEFESWAHWLPCDRAVAVPCKSAPVLLPYTRSTAHSAGWQWRIPLQHRIGNGHVFSSNFMSEEDATSILLSHLDGEPLADPRTVKFSTGKRKQSWNKNCVAIGLSAGFLEPLESTSIHLIQMGITNLIRYFPTAAFEQSGIDQYNLTMDTLYDSIRDFIILHYKATERTDSDFWNYCREMSVPDSLIHKMNLFRENGHVYRTADDLFNVFSWIEVMHGQRVRPKAYNPLVDLIPEPQIQQYLDEVAGVIKACVDVMPTHAEYIEAECKAKPVMMS